MNFYRDIIDELNDWLVNRGRKPLVVTGMRCIGKTTVLQNFAKKENLKLAYFSFRTNIGLKQVFMQKGDWDAKKIINKLSTMGGVNIDAKQTLVLLDDVHLFPLVLKQLLIFARDVPEYRIIASGTFLKAIVDECQEISLSDFDWIALQPMTFSEFLCSADEKLYLTAKKHVSLIPLEGELHDKLNSAFMHYMFTGGQPIAVDAWLQTGNEEKVQELLKTQCEVERDAIERLAPPKQLEKILEIWDNVAMQLSKDNHKFNFSFMRSGARARDYEKAMDWLELAGLTHRVYCNKKPFVPLSNHDDKSAYKVYLTDPGMMISLTGVTFRSLKDNNPLYSDLKKAIVETVVLQALTAKGREVPRYWQSLGKAELDFIVQSGDEVFPIELRTGTKLGGRCLQVYNMIFSPSVMIRYSMNNLNHEGNLLSIPYYMVDFTAKLILRSKLERS